MIILLKALKVLAKDDAPMEKFAKLNPVEKLHGEHGKVMMDTPYSDQKGGVFVYRESIKIEDVATLIAIVVYGKLDLDFTVCVKDGSGPKYDSLVQACIELKEEV